MRNNIIILALTFLGSAYLLPIVALSQTENLVTKTKIEEMKQQSGTVITMGTTETGTVAGLGKVGIGSVEISNIKTGIRTLGLIVYVWQNITGESSNSYVDYEEIQSLLNGIDYLLAIQTGSIKSQRFFAQFKTKSGLTFSFNYRQGTKISEEGNSISVKSITEVESTVYLTRSQLSMLRKLIEQAMLKLDEIKLHIDN